MEKLSGGSVCTRGHGQIVFRSSMALIIKLRTAIFSFCSLGKLIVFQKHSLLFTKALLITILAALQAIVASVCSHWQRRNRSKPPTTNLCWFSLPSREVCQGTLNYCHDNSFPERSASPTCTFTVHMESTWLEMHNKLCEGQLQCYLPSIRYWKVFTLHKCVPCAVRIGQCPVFYCF